MGFSFASFSKNFRYFKCFNVITVTMGLTWNCIRNWKFHCYGIVNYRSCSYQNSISLLLFNKIRFNFLSPILCVDSKHTRLNTVTSFPLSVQNTICLFVFSVVSDDLKMIFTAWFYSRHYTIWYDTIITWIYKWRHLLTGVRPNNIYSLERRTEKKERKCLPSTCINSCRTNKHFADIIMFYM